MEVSGWISLRFIMMNAASFPPHIANASHFPRDTEDIREQASIVPSPTSARIGFAVALVLSHLDQELAPRYRPRHARYLFAREEWAHWDCQDDEFSKTVLSESGNVNSVVNSLVRGCQRR